MVVVANEQEPQLILSLDNTDVDKDDQVSPSIQSQFSRGFVEHDKARSCLGQSNPIENARKGTIYRFGLFCVRIC